MNAFALWRRLDLPGHDAAHLAPDEAGYSLQGTAVFRHAAGPACVRYGVEVDAAWRTRQGHVRGCLAGGRFDHTIRREPDGWHLDGGLVCGLEQLWDLDFGFTPATNLLQIRRAGPAPGQSVDLPVAWFDIGATTLTLLPQRYEWRDASAFWYSAPTVAYQGLLELAENGFVRRYPGLWEMEP